MERFKGKFNLFQTLLLKQVPQTFSLSVAWADSFFVFPFFWEQVPQTLFWSVSRANSLCKISAPRLLREVMSCSVLQCVAMCCSMLQCVAVCCSVFLVVYCSVLQCVAVCCSVLQCVAVCCSVAAVCCSVLVCVAVCCSVLRLVYRDHLPLWCQNSASTRLRRLRSRLRFNTLHHTAIHCNTLQHTATHFNTLQHTATH